MATPDQHQKTAEDVRRLFAELGEIYARAAAAVPSGSSFASDTGGRVGKERTEASAIIQRIRDIQGF